MAGDRRATMGNLIAQRDIEKVFASDDYTLVGIAGTAGLAIEIVRLYQVELEHYEKIEGTQLTLDGKANRLATMIRGNLGQAMQGLAVVPLFAGFDVDAPDPAHGGRIYSFDVTGGRYPEQYYDSIGSGSLFAKGALKKLWRPGLDAAGAVRVVVEALYDAADDDSATGGPDLTRRIYPVVMLRHRRGHLAGARRRARGDRRRDPGRPQRRGPVPELVSRPARPSPDPTYEIRRPPQCRCRSTPRPSRSCATARSSPARASRAGAAWSC